MSDQDKYRAQQREHTEPTEGNLKVPKLVFAYIFILLIWGVGYYLMQLGKPAQGGDSRSPVVVSSSDDKESSVDGSKIFKANCVACHQANGEGVPGSFPSLVDSEWAMADSVIPVAIIHDGLMGEIEVHGEKYNSAMPNIGNGFSAEELTAVANYIRQNWGNNAKEITQDQVEKYLEEYSDRSTPWTVEELIDEFGEPKS